MNPYLTELQQSKTVYLDTETCYGKPWSVQFSLRPGTAAFIHDSQRDVLRLLGNHLAKPNVLTVVHSALFDIPVLDQVGIQPSRYVDTLVAAYLLQSEPLSLKDLAYRIAGMVMRTYKEMVQGATVEKALVYLEQVMRKFEGIKAEPQMYWEKGLPKFKQPQPIAKKAERIILDTLTKDADPRDRWFKILEGERQIVEDELGSMEEGTLADIPFEEAVAYANTDADATCRIYPYLMERIKAMDLESTLERDMRAIPLCIDMMKNGMKIIPEHFHSLSAYFQSQMFSLDSKMDATVGMKFDAGSPKQVAEILFKHLKLRKVKGDSTGDKILGILKDQHSVVQMIRDWRAYQKLKTTYSDRMPKYADENNRVHPNIRITRVSTGRLSTANPNLLSIPVRTDESKKIRMGFIPEPGNTLVGCDYNQLELRCLAHESQDPTLLEIFRTNKDIHRSTASQMWKIPFEDVTPAQRRCAKSVNFGIIYGIGAKGLHEGFQKDGITTFTQDDCQEFIDMWIAAYPGAQEYMDRTLSHCSRYLYVRTKLGRIRYIPGIRSNNPKLRAESERMAINAPIQGMAADIIKEAMGELAKISEDLFILWLLQVHDELLAEIPKRAVDTAVPVIKCIMENAVPLSVPLVVEPKVSEKSWGEMEIYNG